VKKKIIYEQPLNDRMRILLRLEYLLNELAYHIKGPSEWDSRAAISCYIEINEFINRFDFKATLIDNLSHHAKCLERWQQTPDVDNERLLPLLAQTKNLSEQLESVNINGKQGSILTQSDLVHTVQKRRSILGGTSHSDLPGYYYWLQKSPKHRMNDLNEWIAPIEPLHEALKLSLYLTRHNAIVSQEVASIGYYQSKLDAHVSYELIQVSMPTEHACYPEINGGKQRFTIRFLEQPQFNMPPSQSKQNIKFELGLI
jgi:cell division protein ZapD